MEFDRTITPIEVLRQDPLFKDVLTENPWAGEMLEKLARFDRSTFDHSIRVARLYAAISIQDEDHPETKEAKMLAGLLHDIGKIETDLTILRKEGSLSDDERAEMNEHVRTSYDMVSPHNTFAGLIIIAHHERQPNPYPRKNPRSSSHLDQDCQDFALCDSIDGMMSRDRMYREAPIDEEVAIQELSRFHPMPRIEEVMTIWKDLYSSIPVETHTPSGL